MLALCGESGRRRLLVRDAVPSKKSPRVVDTQECSNAAVTTVNAPSYLLMFVAQEPDAQLHGAASSEGSAAVAAQAFSSMPAATCPSPAALSLDFGTKSRKGCRSENNGTTQSNGGCVYCSRNVPDEPCPVHSRRIPDTKVLPLALATLPSSLSFIRKQADAVPSGVRARCRIAARTVMGPMRGVTCSHAKLQRTLSTLDDRSTLHRDAGCHTESLHGCNWMQFVRLARNTAERNLSVYDMGGQVYFMAMREIIGGEELRVWYSARYAQEMKVTKRLKKADNQSAMHQLNAGDDVLPQLHGDDLVGESALPSSPDENVMLSGADDLLPPETQDSIFPERNITDDDNEDLNHVNVVTDPEMDIEHEEEDADTLLDAGAEDSDASYEPKDHRKLMRRRVTRFRHDNPEMVARLEAVLTVNPFQYAQGSKEQLDAWDAAVRLLDPAIVTTRNLLRFTVGECLRMAPKAAQQFDSDAGPVFQRTSISSAFAARCSIGCSTAVCPRKARRLTFPTACPMRLRTC
ncbi:uncharacterized protein LOC129594996 isoform X2 [Paramacrobiotus metropolitanus]|uniref:uncharacterized protein LOC129594996 isoform X2 n=1 Tax=Paramacrobiotus metropolitanus TaxID=2943436 RepID=UPI002445BD41|nr:uncharacterized protein LOC129594996 isoform X2 [Paramacrobiotus metropolitanus]